MSAGGFRLPARVVAVTTLAGIAAALGYYTLGPTLRTWPRLARLRAYLADPAAHAGWQLRAGARCPGAPFMIPTDGYLGFGYDDSWSLGHRHTGFDIFGPRVSGLTPVVAAYPGYLTRLPEWKSTVIVRVPSDPLRAGRQIWVYYTHLADAQGASYVAPEFPPGTAERYVEAGTLLGHQGNFSGEPGNPVGVHLHFSIVRDDGRGNFLNESKIENTYDPSPYLGLRGHARDDWSAPVVCR